MKETLRKNLDEVIWNIEQARVEVSEHHIVKLVAVGKYSEEVCKRANIDKQQNLL